MKTLLDYTEKMPIGLKMRTLNNAVKQKGRVSILFEKHATFGDAINMAFTWRDTSEGHEFWEYLMHNGIKDTFKRFKPQFKKPKL